MKDKFINWGIFIILSIIWGSSFKLMKVGMEALSPYHVAAIRMLSAGVVLLPFAVTAIKHIPRNKFLMVILSGLLGNFIPAFLFCIAETRIDSSLAGILNALTPLFTILIGVLVFKLAVTTQRYVGVATGFIGLCLLFMARGDISFSYISFSLLVLLATFLYGINVNIVSNYLQNVGSLNIAALAFSFLLIPSFLALVFTDYFKLPLLTHNYVIATSTSTVLGVFGTAIATILFYVLVKRAGALFASTVTYGIPFVAVFWGLISNEHITLTQVACLGIILVGVYLVNKPEAISTKNAGEIKA